MYSFYQYLLLESILVFGKCPNKKMHKCEHLISGLGTSKWNLKADLIDCFTYLLFFFLLHSEHFDHKKIFDSSFPLKFESVHQQSFGACEVKAHATFFWQNLVSISDNIEI